MKGALFFWLPPVDVNNIKVNTDFSKLTWNYVFCPVLELDESTNQILLHGKIQINLAHCGQREVNPSRTYTQTENKYYLP